MSRALSGVPDDLLVLEHLPRCAAVGNDDERYGELYCGGLHEGVEVVVLYLVAGRSRGCYWPVRHRGQRGAYRHLSSVSQAYSRIRGQKIPAILRTSSLLTRPT